MQTLLLVYSVSLAIAVLLSERFQRSILSASVLFLVAGILTAAPLFGPVKIDPAGPLVSTVAEIALFSVLFTDGMLISFQDLATAMRLPGRALLFGMPLTMAGTALMAHSIAGLAWVPAFLLGAILSPTDPVLVSAIIGREGIPQRLRHLLHIESGLNDGLALPFVVVLMSTLGKFHASIGALLLELAAGVLVGAIVPWVLVRLERSRLFGATQAYTPLLPAAAALLAFSICKLSQANEYLAAFTAGVTLATISPEMRAGFHQFGETLTELVKLAALLLFGALLSPRFFREVGAGGYLFAATALLVVRPVAMRVALLHAGLPRAEIWTAGWFGPKGFASVTYSLLVFRSGLPGAYRIVELAAITIAISIVAHSSTDVPIARWLESRPSGRTEPPPEPS